MNRKFFLLLLALLLMGCGVEELEEQSQTNEPKSNTGLSETNTPIELELWSHFGGWEYSIEQFEKAHPGVTINVKTIAYENATAEYLKALAEKQTPDIMVIDSKHFGDFTALDGLEDLAGEPYKVEQYHREFSDPLKKLGKSYDGERTIGIPFDSTPLITYYRADIMEDYGFPSDPEELGVFMEDPANWLEMAKAFKKDNKWVIQGELEPIELFESTRGVFNQDLAFLRNNEEFAQAIDIARSIKNDLLVSPSNVYEPSGMEALKEDRLVMFYFGTWGSDSLENWVPEQSGKWRATRLPFNLYGWSNSPLMSIPTESKHKELAWEFVEFYAFEVFPSSSSVTQDEYLGGQRTQLLFEQIMEKVEEPTLTPLDDRADAIWNETISSGLQSNLKTKEILDLAEKNINEKLRREIEILKQ